MGGTMKYFLKKLLGHEIFTSIVSWVGYKIFFEKFIKPAPPPPTYLMLNVRSLTSTSILLRTFTENINHTPRQNTFFTRQNHNSCIEMRCIQSMIVIQTVNQNGNVVIVLSKTLTFPCLTIQQINITYYLVQYVHPPLT